MKKLMVVLMVVGLLSAAAVAFAAPIADGYGGVTNMSSWVSTGGSSSWYGWWDYDDGGWVLGTTYSDDALVVRAFVQLFVSQTQQTQADFHWGVPPYGPLTAVLPGKITQNHPCWVGILKSSWGVGDQTKASELPLTEALYGPTAMTSPAFPGMASTGEDATAIPLDWKMTLFVPGATAHSAMNYIQGSAGWGWWSPGRLPVGATDYQFEITATPKAWQADGIYTLDPDVVVVPDL